MPQTPNPRTTVMVSGAARGARSRNSFAAVLQSPAR